MADIFEGVKHSSGEDFRGSTGEELRGVALSGALLQHHDE